MDALNLYSERIAQDRSRFTGGARKRATLSPELKAKMREVARTEKLLREVGIDVPLKRKRTQKPRTQAGLEREAKRNLNNLLKSRGLMIPRAPTARSLRNGYVKRGVMGCRSAIDNKDFNYLCNRIKPRKRKGAGLSGVGLSGVGLSGVGLSGLGYSSASGLYAAGLSGGVSMAKVAQMERWTDYQNGINALRNMGHSYREAQQMAKHILRIN
jgi:hypothetical protein